MRRINRFLSAAVAVMMLGSSLSGSVSALGAENAGLRETSAVFNAADAGWDADSGTTAEEGSGPEAGTEKGTYIEAPLANAEEPDKELTDAQEDAGSTGAGQDDGIVSGSEAVFPHELEAEAPETEDIAGTEDSVQTGNARFVIDGEGYTFSLYNGDTEKIKACRSEDELVITNVYGDEAVFSNESVEVSDSSGNEIITAGSGDFMVCADGSFAAESEGEAYIINGSLENAPEEFVFYPVSYTEDSLTLTFSDEEGTYLPFAISAEEGYHAGGWTVPSDADVNETGGGFAGSAVCMGTGMDDGSTFRFSFIKEEENNKDDAASFQNPDERALSRNMLKKTDDVKESNEDTAAGTGSRKGAKRASGTITFPSEDRTVTFDANGGTFDGGSSQNNVTYTIPETYVSKTENVSEDGEKTGPYGSNLSVVDTVTVPGAEELHITITYQTEDDYYKEFVAIFDGNTAVNDSNMWKSVCGRLRDPNKRTGQYDIKGDTAQFYFRSNDTDNDYLGYYALVRTDAYVSEGEFKDPSMSGTKFISWNTKQDGTGRNIDLSSFEPSENTVLYAQYENKKEAVWFEDGEMIIKDVNGPIEPYEAVHGNTVKRTPFKTVTVSSGISQNGCEFEYADYFSFDIYVQDEDGKYVTFDDKYNMSGISDEPAAVTVKNGDQLELPAGDYQISFKDEGKKYPGRNRLKKEQSYFVPDPEEVIYYSSYRFEHDPELSVTDDSSSYNVRFISTKPDLHFFYIDPTGNVTQPTRFRLYGWKESGKFIYKVSRSADESGNTVYTYDPENGTEDWMEIAPNSKIIVRDLPISQGEIEYLSALEGWDMIIPRHPPDPIYYGTVNGYDTIRSTDSWGQEQSFIVANAEAIYGIRKYKKTGVGKGPIEASFSLTTDFYDKEHLKKYVLKHYDTYEYFGETYENVYIAQKELKPIDSNDADTVITTKNGEFTLMCPAICYGADKWHIKEAGASYSCSGISPYLVELDSEKGFYTSDDYVLGNRYWGQVNCDPRSAYGLFDKKDNKFIGSYISGLPDGQLKYKDYTADDFEVRLVNEEAVRSSVVLDDSFGIINDAYPKIKKTVTDSYISSGQPFKFEVWAERWDENGRPYNTKLDTVTVKNGEELTLDPDTVSGMTDREASHGYIYIKEIDNDGWEAPSVSGNGVYENENVEGTYKFWSYTYYRETNTQPAMEFTNTRKTVPFTLKKSVTGISGDYTHRFKVRLWDETDGKEYPFSGYAFNIGSRSYNTNENGEVFIDIGTHLTEEAQAEFPVPDRCHYKIEEVSSTLGTYSVQKTNDAGVVPETGITSTWVNEYRVPDVTISKTDINGNEIEGAQLKITGRADGASQDIVPIEWTSEAGKNKTVALMAGTYTLHEEAVPEGGVYAAAADITFTVDKDGNVKVSGQDADKITMVDTYAPHDVVISKTDINGDEIEGAQLKVTGREEGSEQDITPIEWISEAGKNKTISVKPGAYTLHEEAVPESGAYAAASDITFTVDKDGGVKVSGQNVDKVTMVDGYHLVSLKVSKTVEGSLGSRDKQFSFSLKLTGPDGTPYQKPALFRKGMEEGALTPDETGKITFTLSHGEEIELSGIIYGTAYEVTEADYSADGYRTSSVNAKGSLAAETTEVLFENTKDAAVPTGIAAPGIKLPFIAILLGAAAATAVICKRRKNKA